MIYKYVLTTFLTINIFTQLWSYETNDRSRKYFAFPSTHYTLLDVLEFHLKGYFVILIEDLDDALLRAYCVSMCENPFRLWRIVDREEILPYEIAEHYFPDYVSEVSYVLLPDSDC